MGAQSLCVGAVQMVSENGRRDANLERAALGVRQAAGRGAKLIALPELFSGGYWLDERAWETAEPQDGPTEAFLRETAFRHAVYVGGSYLQASGEDFFNVFALATPDGTIAGRIPKQQAASVEAYLFRGRPSSHIIETDFGRVGVGICYDNAFRYTADAFISGDADIAMMCYSAPTPQRTWYYGPRQVEAFLASFRHAAQKYARMLGIPAVLVNKSGRWKSAMPSFFPSHDSKYDGQSEIADSNGEIVAGLKDEEAVIVGKVTLDPTLKRHALGAEYSRRRRWVAQVPFVFKLFPLIEKMGARSYAKNSRRRTQALAKSGDGHANVSRYDWRMAMPTLRHASREDLTRVTSWLRSQEECELWAGWRVQFPIDIGVLPSAIEFTEKNSYVWSSGQQLIAFGQIVDKPDGRRHLARIIVDPLVRRCGYGEAFVRELLKNASSTRVSLNVAERNTGAVALYRKLGFAEAARPPAESASANSRYMEYSAQATTSR